MTSLEEDKQLYHDLKALKDTPGGKHLIDGLVRDIIGHMHWLANGYENPELKLTDIQAKCAKLQIALGMLRVLTNAEKNEEDVDALIEEALRA